MHLPSTNTKKPVKNLRLSLSGCLAIKARGQRINAVQTKTYVKTQFPNLFEGLGKLDEGYKIVLQWMGVTIELMV